ncbi:MAG: T9SS type A sorting domain-containing protein [Flavobacteriaceae bacterium]|nr:VCBS repeat-containing protein [Bacteroidia bacterium]NNF76197.1 T9SS type A sorting domain-containing protein [Flavobacteriaceae bacterium]NNK72905.1 T9SS type A sorting domain-containing protein [Flavobacteriaceae bacterium]
MKNITYSLLLLLLPSGLLWGQISSDTCADAATATPITGPGIYSVIAIDGSEIPDPICAENGTSSMLEFGEWYRYTPTVSSYITISTDSNILTQNSGIDTRVHVYTGSCGSLVCLAGDDDSGGGFTSIVGFDVVSGETYYIAWDDRWDESGFDFQLSEGSPPPIGPISFTSQTVAATGSDRGVVDMNNDKLDDLVSVTDTNININYQLPGGGFNSVNITTSQADHIPSWSLAAGDIDGNGYNDLLYGGGAGVTFMYANSDGTAFTEQSGSDYVFSQRSNFIDINNDGALDAFVCHDVAPNVYYINDGSGNLTFYQGASTAVPKGLGTHTSGGNYGTVWVDYDNDRDMDLFIAKCRGGDVTHKWNELWQNDGSGTYTNVADGSGYYSTTFPAEGHNNSSNLGDPVQTWSSAWADFDNDGDMDVYVGASSSSDGGHKLMRNNGDGTFSDATSGSGVSVATYGIENAPGDFDNDGYVDILTNGGILFNNGDFTFTHITNDMPPSGPIGDANNDGFLDVFNGNLRINDGNSNNWLKVCTNGTNSNINGIGARLEITSPGIGKQIRDVRSGEGFRYMSSLNTHFGLGADTSVTNLTIYWPSGTVDVITNPSINSTLIVTEGETLSLEQSLVQDLIIYPNPTKDVLNLNATYGFENAIYTIFDLNGKRVMNNRFNSNTIDVSQLSTGNYILRILDNGKINSQKFIKY